MGMAMSFDEREFDYGELALFTPKGDIHDVDRALGAYIDWFEDEYDVSEPDREGEEP